MQLYNISEIQVVGVLAAPETREPSIKGRTNATKLLAGRRLRVTYLQAGQVYVIITVTPLEAPEETP